MPGQAGREPEGHPAGRQTPELDTRHAHSARVYNYWLGGTDNFAADRETAEQAIAANPGIVADVRENRAFLTRAVGYLASECGVRQFLDIGTGLPTANNTHEVAQAAAPQARIVYADNDPVVLLHARALLTSSPEGATAYLDADLRDTSAILREAAQTLDFGQPVALMLLIILHLIPDADDPYGIVATLLDALPSGSYLVLAHPASDILADHGRDDQAREPAHERAEGNHAGPGGDHPLLRRPGTGRARRGAAPAMASGAGCPQPAAGNGMVRSGPQALMLPAVPRSAWSRRRGRALAFGRSRRPEPTSRLGSGRAFAATGTGTQVTGSVGDGDHAEQRGERDDQRDEVGGS